MASGNGRRKPDPAHSEAAGPAAAVVRRAVRLKAGRAEGVDELVAEERPLTVYVDGEELATLVASPTDLEELLVGFLTSEGVIAGPDEIRWMAVAPENGEAWVATRGGSGIGAHDRLMRHVEIATCCGRTRPTAYFQSDLEPLRRLRSPAPGAVLSAAAAGAVMRTLEERTRTALFGATGGVHSALLAGPDGEVLALRSDVGRHNALDKLYGFALLARITTDATVIAFSGRISSEVLLKVAKIGSPILLSKSAPTSLALELAEDLGITTVGFIRDDRMTVYTAPQRIAGAAPPAPSG